jgi:hypothetical protein
MKNSNDTIGNPESMYQYDFPAPKLSLLMTDTGWIYHFLCFCLTSVSSLIQQNVTYQHRVLLSCGPSAPQFASAPSKTLDFCHHYRQLFAAPLAAIC